MGPGHRHGRPALLDSGSAPCTIQHYPKRHIFRRGSQAAESPRSLEPLRLATDGLSAVAVAMARFKLTALRITQI